MLYTALWGIIIGILISAPLGPIGVLVIQRTLNDGRRVGLITGLGAAVSDIIYAMISGLGLSFIVDFITSNGSSLQIIGSIIIFIFGLYLWKKNPVKDLTPSKTTKSSYFKYFITGLLLTLSNPMIIFFYLALFARTNFLISAGRISDYFLGYGAIAVGALCWWFFITWIMNKVRAHFKLRSLFLVNKIIVIVMILLSLVGFVYGIKQLFLK